MTEIPDFLDEIEQCGHCGRNMALEEVDRIGFVIWACHACQMRRTVHQTVYTHEIPEL